MRSEPLFFALNGVAEFLSADFGMRLGNDV